jgi:hypothetical protein
MTESPAVSANVFLFQLAPAPQVAALDLERELLRRAADLGLAARPRLDPSMFRHRVLRDAAGALAWEISFEGLDLPDDEAPSSESLGDAVLEEVRARLAGLAEIGSWSAFTDLSTPAATLGVDRDVTGALQFDETPAPGWEDYAAGAGTPESGHELPADLAAGIESVRAAVSVPKDLKPYKAGHMYTGSTDKAHLAYLKGYFEARAARANAADRRKILAFAAFQSREGSTAAINTYDNQIVTWGTGWGGLGGLGGVMTRATASAAVRDRLGSGGVRYREKNVYDVVDLASKRVLTGKREALEIIRGSLPLVGLLIDLAVAPATRDAVTEAQLVTFMRSSADISGADAIATQALFNLTTHLKHWAPGFVVGCLEWAVPQLGPGEPSAERDRQLAGLVGRYFYGKARMGKPAWTPRWEQLQLYIRHMKADGLDCTADPFFAAFSAPGGDPFVDHPLPGTPAPKPAPAPAPKPAPAPAPAPAPTPAPTPTPAPAPAGLKHAPLAGQTELEAIARGKGSLRRGAHGPAVKALQQAFLRLGVVVPGGDDGVFGAGLEGVVEKFQAERGLSADGVVGRGTLAALDERLAPQGPGYDAVSRLK